MGKIWLSGAGSFKGLIWLPGTQGVPGHLGHQVTQVDVPDKVACAWARCAHKSRLVAPGAPHHSYRTLQDLRKYALDFCESDLDRVLLDFRILSLTHLSRPLAAKAWHLLAAVTLDVGLPS